VTCNEKRLYHITTREEAGSVREAGHYTPEAFRDEGFIHCSYLGQVTSVADRIFRGRDALVLLEIDRSRLEIKVVDENLEGGGELFPHLYGRLPMSALIRIHPFPCGEDGRFVLPRALENSGNSFRQ
jgi:uncharacterized protein (DUF952 family)